MKKNAHRYLLLIFLSFSCGSNKVDTGTKVHWTYTRDAEAEKPFRFPDMSFKEIKKTVDFNATKDSTVIGIWEEYRLITILFSKNDGFFIQHISFRGDEISTNYISECTYLRDVRDGKTILRQFCWDGQEVDNYIISYPDSLLMNFNAHNDSLAIHYRSKKISHIMQPIEEKRAKQKLYKERDTLTVGWYAEFGDISWERIIKKGDTYYIMAISESRYEVNTLLASTHPLGIRLDIAPRNDAMAEWLKKNNIYCKLSAQVGQNIV